jgi:DNA-directed RNA polymerase specialized sigma24 family protein
VNTAVRLKQERAQRKQQEADAFRRAFAAVPDLFTADEKAIVEAACFEGRTVCGGADHLGANRGTAWHRLANARRGLNAWLRHVAETGYHLPR